VNKESAELLVSAPDHTKERSKWQEASARRTHDGDLDVHGLPEDTGHVLQVQEDDQVGDVSSSKDDLRRVPVRSEKGKTKGKSESASPLPSLLGSLKVLGQRRLT
jgi:hypothetical protein